MANTTWNPSDKSGGITLSGGNLVATATATGNQGVRAADRQVSGKYYWEITPAVNVTNQAVGITNGAISIGSIQSSGGVGSVGCAYCNNAGGVFVDGSASLGSIGTWVVGTVIGIALDLDHRLIWFRLGSAGNWNGSAGASPAAGVGGFSVPGIWAAYPLDVFTNVGANPAHTANFGDSAFAGTVPSGFTSGFPTGTPALIAANTQTALEQWAMPNAQAQATQLAAEVWANALSGPRQALLTQIALEEWGVLPQAIPLVRQTVVSVSVS